jgi:hypothetical protein
VNGQRVGQTVVNDGAHLRAFGNAHKRPRNLQRAAFDGERLDYQAWLIVSVRKPLPHPRLQADRECVSDEAAAWMSIVIDGDSLWPARGGALTGTVQRRERNDRDDRDQES